MSKLSNYFGSIDLISGLRPKGGQDFPLMDAHSVLVGENGERLDERLTKFEGLNDLLSSTQKTEFSKVLFDYTTALNTTMDVTAVSEKWAKYDIVVGGIDYRTNVGQDSADDSVNEYERNVIFMVRYLFPAVLRINPKFKFFWYIDLGVTTGGGSDNRIRSAVNYIAHAGGTFLQEDKILYGVDENGNGVNFYEGGGSKAIAGVFFDDAEFGFGVTRSRINVAIKACHDNGINAFMNSFHPVGTLFLTDPTQNAFNPEGAKCLIDKDDYFLLESCFSTPGSSTTIMTSSDYYEDLFTWANQYRSLGYGRPVTLNYITTSDASLNWDAIQCVKSYCLIASFIGGANGVAFNGAALGLSEIMNYWEEPDVIKALHSDQIYPVNIDFKKRYVTNGNLQLTINLAIADAPDNHIGVIGRELFEEYLYFEYNNSKGANAWETIYSVQSRLENIIRSVDMKYNDDPSLMTGIRSVNVPGSSKAVARADHTHQAGPFIYVKKDEWYMPPHLETSCWKPNNNFNNLSDKEVEYDLETKSGKIIRDGTSANWWELIIAEITSAENLRGKKIEFGIKFTDDTNVNDSGMYLDLLLGSSIISSIQLNTIKYDGLYKQLRYCSASVNFPDDANGSISLRLCKRITTSDGMKSFILGWEDFYISDVTGYYLPWYTNIDTSNLTWTGNNNFINNLQGSFEQQRERSGVIQVTDSRWWTITLSRIPNMALYAGKTIEIGIKLNRSSQVGTVLQFWLNFGNKNYPVYLHSNAYGGVYGENKGYIYLQINVPTTATGVGDLCIGRMITNANQTEFYINIVDYYAYDLSEDVPVEDERTSKTILQFYRTDSFPIDCEADTIYLTKEGIMVTDNYGNPYVISKVEIPSID